MDKYLHTHGKVNNFHIFIVFNSDSRGGIQAASGFDRQETEGQEASH